MTIQLLVSDLNIMVHALATVGAIGIAFSPADRD
jgi:hypothetical protein